MFENRKLVLLCFFIAFLTIISAIIIPEIIKVQYAFYNIVKLLTFSTLGYISYYLFKRNEIVLFFLMLVNVILYNPLSPIYLSRNIWIVIDVLIIILLIYSFIKSIIFYKNDKKIKTNFQSLDSQEIEKLQDYYHTNCNNYKEKHKLVKLIGITLGDFNEHFIERLCNDKDVESSSNTVFESIKYLANNNYYNKDVINDLYSLNDVRNRIVHDKDRTPITIDNIDYFLDMAKSSISKASFLYKNSFK